ncbi:LamG domain-containing protein [Schleiferiaceae bacterium]|nr:LamG domain-containing protein [Schleiferiaceae bacterium]
MWLPFTKAEPLGENLVVNGGFEDSSNWVSVGTAELPPESDVGTARIYTTSDYAGIYQSSSNWAFEKYYIVTITVSEYNSGQVFLLFDGGSAGGEAVPQAVGTYNLKIFNTTGSATFYINRLGGGTTDVTISNISVEEYAQETPDISGNDNNAILKTGKALVFAGNDSVETSFPSSKTIKAIAFWIYPTHSASFETLFNLGITNIPVSNLGDRVIELNHLTIRNRQHYPLNFDVYIDGVYRGETNWNGDNPTLELNQWQRVVLVNSNGTSTVNDTFDIAYTGSGSHGRFKMSDLQIYGADWTTDDIAYDYANPQKLVTDNASSNVTLNDLHAWWHMSEGDGTIAFDSAPLIGKELLVNGDFATDSDWVMNGGWYIENGKATKSGSDFGGLAQLVNLPNARVFQLTFDVSGTTTGSLTSQIYGGGGVDSFFNITNISNGSYSFTTTSTTDRTAFNFNGYGGFDGSIDNVSIKEVYNIDGETYDGSSLGATYDDAQERIPQLGMMNWSKGSNLLEYSEDITLANGYGKNTAVTLESNAGVSPIGTGNATKMSNPSGYGIFYNTQSLDAGETYTFSFYVKNINATNLYYRVYNNTTTSDLISATSYYSQTSTSEWARVLVTFTTTNSGSYNCYLNSGVSNGSALFWGVQLEDADSVSAYRRTNGTTVTDATLISCATDSQKDILGNAVRVKGSGFNLDGTGYGEVPHTTDFDFGTGNFSVSAWVKYSYVPKGSSYNAIYTNGGQVDAAGTFGIMTINPDRVRVLVNNTSCQSTTIFSQGEWLHMVATRDSGTISLYINGNKTPESTATNSDSVTSSQNPRIGFDSTTSRFYNDLIDDVQVYDEALTPEEIEQNYNATKSGHNN